MSKAYSFAKTTKFDYVLVDHNIRKNSSQEALKVKKLLQKNNVNLNIILNTKKIYKNIQGEARNLRYQKLAEYCKRKKINTLHLTHKKYPNANK